MDDDLREVRGEKVLVNLKVQPKTTPTTNEDEENTIGVEDLMDEVDMEHAVLYEDEQATPTPTTPATPSEFKKNKEEEKEEVEGEEVDEEKLHPDQKPSPESDLPVLSPAGSEKYKEEEHHRSELDRAVSEGVCTYHVTKNTYMLQTWYSCFQCNLIGGLGCCQSCAETCHKDHTGVRLNEKNSPCRAFCDCGATREECLCVRKEFTSSTEECPAVDSSFTGKGIYYFKNGDVYIGNWEHGKMHGKGKMSRRTGEFSTYEGDFFENEMKGKGVIHFFNNVRFEGNVEHGKANGRGLYYDGDVLMYDGEWMDDFFQGNGTRYYPPGPNDDVLSGNFKPVRYYVGQWAKGKRNGHGQSFYRNGKLRYDGKWKGNRYEGQGTSYNFQTGKVFYVGEWKAGKTHGKGKCFMTNGARYEGEFKENKMDGNGVYYNPDGSVWYMGAWSLGKRQGWGECTEKVRKRKNTFWRYIGMWKGDKKHGNGKQYLNDDFLYYDGYYKKGEKDGTGICYFKNGEKFEGSFKEGKKEGLGTYFYSNKKKMYEGCYVDNKFNGKGKCWYGDGIGAVYEGDFKDGQKHGKGTLYYPDGVSVHYEGEWENDSRQGLGKNIWEDGGTYIGHWKDNLQSGKGEYCLGDGKPHSSGSWKEGELDGEGVKYFANGEKYEGMFSVGKNSRRFSAKRSTVSSSPKQ